mgnify:CR=1 FL=1
MIVVPRWYWKNHRVVRVNNSLENSINRIKDKAIVPILFTEESKLSAITNAKKANIIRNNNHYRHTKVEIRV